MDVTTYFFRCSIYPPPCYCCVIKIRFFLWFATLSTLAVKTIKIVCINNTGASCTADEEENNYTWYIVCTWYIYIKINNSCERYTSTIILFFIVCVPFWPGKWATFEIWYTVVRIKTGIYISDQIEHPAHNHPPYNRTTATAVQPTFRTN